MRSSAWLRARPRTLASAGAVTAAAVTITTLAFAYQGLPTTEVDLHDGGVWVTKQSALLVGHFNHESQVLDGGLRASSDDYDILQSGENVLVVDEASSSVAVVDPAMVSMAEAANIPGGAKVELGGSTVAILDQNSGDLWIAPAESVGSFQVEGTDPVTNLGEAADVAVGVDGVVHAVSAETSEVVTVRVQEDGTPSDPVRTGLGDLPGDAELSITAVGERPVVLDASTGSVYADGRSFAVDGARTGVLQPPTARWCACLSTAPTPRSSTPDPKEPPPPRCGWRGALTVPGAVPRVSYATAWAMTTTSPATSTASTPPPC
jgi:hypothetical protein